MEAEEKAARAAHRAGCRASTWSRNTHEACPPLQGGRNGHGAPPAMVSGNGGRVAGRIWRAALGASPSNGR
eukprot:10421844-Lingulodinium_polyedra.AAC.1